MQKPEVVILHGWAMSSQNEAKWKTFRNRLLSDGIRSTFLPIPGLDSSLSEPWTLQNYVEWLDAQLPNNKQHLLLGHSFGGQLAVRYTATHPHKISKLILVASAGIRDRALSARLKRSVFFVLAKVGKMLFDHPFLRKILYMFAREHDYEQAGPVMKKTMQLVTADEIRDDISKITCPVQLVWGKLDTSTPYKNTDVFIQAIPTAELCTIATARHSPQFTHPEETAGCISQFVLEK